MKKSNEGPRQGSGSGTKRKAGNIFLFINFKY